MALALTKPQARKLYVSCFWAQKLVLGQLELLPYLWQTTPEISRGKEGLNQMTNSTKLTDIPGASEALPKPIESKGDYFQAGWFYEMDDIGDIHLEVDVEAMALELAKAVFGDLAKTKESVPNALWLDYMNFAKHLSTTEKQWARLVRR